MSEWIKSIICTLGIVGATMVVIAAVIVTAFYWFKYVSSFHLPLFWDFLASIAPALILSFGVLVREIHRDRIKRMKEQL